jgi:hypothetical protein
MVSGVGLGSRPRLGNQSLVQGRAAPPTAKVVRTDPTGDPQQPRKRIASEVVEPAPSRQKGLGNHILNSRRLDTARHVPIHGHVVFAKDTLEPNRQLVHTHDDVRQRPPITARLRSRYARWLLQNSLAGRLRNARRIGRVSREDRPAYVMTSTARSSCSRLPRSTSTRLGSSGPRPPAGFPADRRSHACATPAVTSAGLAPAIRASRSLMIGRPDHDPGGSLSRS